jgi:hypothetical protein
MPEYTISEFDGKAFTPIHEGKHRLHPQGATTLPRPSATLRTAGESDRLGADPKCRDAVQPDFQLSTPVVAQNHSDGVRLFAEPVGEIGRSTEDAPSKQGSRGESVEIDVEGDLFDVRAIFEVGDAKVVGLDVGGNHHR